MDYKEIAQEALKAYDEERKSLRGPEYILHSPEAILPLPLGDGIRQVNIIPTKPSSGRKIIFGNTIPGSHQNVAASVRGYSKALDNQLLSLNELRAAASEFGRVVRGELPEEPGEYETDDLDLTKELEACQTPSK